MKWKPIKLALMITLAFLLINFTTSLGSKSKALVISRSKNHNKIKKEVLSLKAQKLTLKDGPISWDDLSDQAFQTLIGANSQNEKKEIPYTPGQGSSFKTSYAPQPSSQTSEGTKSKTFRTVSPNDDTTINLQGQKYSNLVKTTANNNVKSGFMGGSRLTRF